MFMDEKQEMPASRHVSFDLLNNAKKFDGIITNDETWYFPFDLEKQSIHLGRKNHAYLV